MGHQGEVKVLKDIEDHDVHPKVAARKSMLGWNKTRCDVKWEMYRCVPYVRTVLGKKESRALAKNR